VSVFNWCSVTFFHHKIPRAHPGLNPGRRGSTKLDLSFVQTRTTVRFFYNLLKTPFFVLACIYKLLPSQPAMTNKSIYEKHDNEIKQPMLTVNNRFVNFQTYEYKDINEEHDTLKHLLS
jgi:hypothetical protein